MEFNKEFKQLFVNNYIGYTAFKGQVVDKIAFSDRGDSDENMFIITFTDKTFVCVGVHFKDLDNGDVEPQIKNLSVMSPENFNGGNFEHYCCLTNNGAVELSGFVQILIDLGIWKLETEDVLKIIKNDKKKKEEREYNEYLRLKEKYEGHN